MQTKGSLDGLSFCSGAMNKAKEPSTIDTPTVSIIKDCDLDISISNNIESVKTGELVTFSVTIEDKQGNYDANSVKIKLTPDIP